LISITFVIANIRSISKKIFVIVFKNKYHPISTSFKISRIYQTIFPLHRSPRPPKKRRPVCVINNNNLPVPDPMAPRASAMTESAPIHIPPNQAAVGIYLKKLLHYIT